MTQATVEQIRWTIADLEYFPDNSNRYEIIDGELFVTRAPHIKHQGVAGAVHAELRAWSLQSQLGEPFVAPGVIFSEADAVIPDVIWISRERMARLVDDSGHLTGAPELIVEVLSMSEKDKKRDRKDKLQLYSVQGVTEYWIADREEVTIEIFRRENDSLTKVMTLDKEDKLTSPLLPGFSCEVGSLFS